MCRVHCSYLVQNKDFTKQGRSSGAGKFGVSSSSLVARQRKASKKSDIGGKPYRVGLTNIVLGSELIGTDPDLTKIHRKMKEGKQKVFIKFYKIYILYWEFCVFPMAISDFSSAQTFHGTRKSIQDPSYRFTDILTDWDHTI